MAWPVMPEAPKTSAVRGGVVVDIVSYENVSWEDRMKDRVARLRAPLPFDVHHLSVELMGLVIRHESE